MAYEETNPQLMRLTNHSTMLLIKTNQQLMRLTNHSIMLLIKNNQQLMRLTNHSMMLLIKTNSLWSLKNTLESIFNDAMNRDLVQSEFDSGKCHHSLFEAEICMATLGVTR